MPAARKKIAPTARVRAEWERRVAAEYGSAAVTQHLTLWLIQIGASPDLIRAGLRITDDELHHAELAHRVVVACGGGPFTLDRNQLGLHRSDGESLEAEVLAACVGVFCLGETLAVPLFRHLREPCSVPVARRALDRVLRDEVRHRDFGWALLGSLLAAPDGAERRARVEQDLPAQLATLRGSYAPDEPEEIECSDDQRAWGLMPASDYRDALLRTVERDYLPRFGRLGIDARRAWATTGA